MDKKRVLRVLGPAVMMTLCIFMASQFMANAQECRIVRIHSGVETDSGKIVLEPDTMHVNKGTCAIWTNFSGGKMVSIRFSEGKKCEANTDSPTLFRLDDKNCYVTGYIPEYGTSSLVFKERGIFEYVVDAKEMESVKGKIIVQ